MAPRTLTQIGKVKIKLNGRDGIYFLAWPNPHGGPQVLESTGHKASNERQLSGESIPVVVKELARKKLDEITQSGYADRILTGIPVLMAFADPIKRSKGAEDRKTQLFNFADYFHNWLEVHKPYIKFWREITPSVIHDYIEYQHERGLKPKTLKHYLSPISITANYWSAENPDLYRPLKIISPHLQEKRKPAKHYLTLKQAQLLLIEADKAANRGVYHTILLGCFAGLNIMEILRLSPDNFDLATCTLTITESKNQFRERTIPLLPMVAKNLKDFQRVAKATGEPATLLSIVQAVKVVIQWAAKAHPDHAAAFNAINPKDIRKTFVNVCREAGISGELIGAYVGHRPTSITNQVYNDLQHVEHMRDNVIKPLEKHIKKVNAVKAV